VILYWSLSAMANYLRLAQDDVPLKGHFPDSRYANTDCGMVMALKTPYTTGKPYISLPI
jgi:hypothetical protein